MATIPKILTLPEERPLQAPAYFHVMAKPTGAICNLDCEVRFACHGGCPRNRFIQTPDGEEELNYLCAGYKAFFTHVDRPMRLMASLLRQGKYADEVMGILANEEKVAIQAAKKVGRNELCPCGSGKKYKHCHGSKGQMLS